MSDQAQSGPYDNVMTDVSGKVRLEGGDPRWIQLFSVKAVPYLVDADVTWYGSRLIENNRSTGNFIQLLDQTLNRLQQVTSRKSSPSGQALEQCCVSLYLSTLLLHHFIAFTTPQQLSDHLFPNELRGGPSSRGTTVLEKLLMEIGLAIDSPSVNVWMGDVKFFCSEFLICFCSAQIYSPLRQNHEFPGVKDSNDMMLSFLYGRAETQLRGVLGSSQHSSSSAFTACLAVQLVRGLLNFACGADMQNGMNSAKVADVASTHTPSTQMLQDLLTHYRSLAATSSSSTEENGRPDLNGIGGTVQDMLIEFLKILPFGVLHRIFSPSSRATSNTVTIGGADLSPSPSSSASSSASAVTLGGKQGGRGLGLHASALMAAIRVPTFAEPVPVPGAISMSTADPVAERCLALLMILLHNRRTPTAAKPNPFREAFGLVHDPSLRPSSGVGNNNKNNNNSSGYGFDGEGGGRGVVVEDEEEGEFAGRGGASASTTSALGATRISVSLPAIIDSMCRKLPDECSTLLLYSFLHSQPNFMDAVIKTGNLAPLLAACLRGLYVLTSKNTRETGPKAVSANSKALSQLYVLIVCLVMLLQDGSVLAELRRGQEVGLLWYKERRADTMALIDACFLCVLRCMTHSVLHIRDHYLLSNSCAILHNLAAQLTCGLQPYTAERLVKVTCKLCERVSKGAAASATADVNNISTGSVGIVGSGDTALLSECVVTLLQVLDSALRTDRLSSNVHILYALMKEFHTVEESFVQPGVLAVLADHGVPDTLAASIVLTARRGLELVEATIGEGQIGKFSAAQTVELIRSEVSKESFLYGKGSPDSRSAGIQGTANSGVSTSTGAGQLRRKYIYEEAENAEEFFVPAAWTAAIRGAPEIPWQLLSMTLVDPIAAGFVAVCGSEDLQNNHPISPSDDDSLRHSGTMSVDAGADQV